MMLRPRHQHSTQQREGRDSNRVQVSIRRQFIRILHQHIQQDRYAARARNLNPSHRHVSLPNVHVQRNRGAQQTTHLRGTA
jgi:hypothetical protein